MNVVQNLLEGCSSDHLLLGDGHGSQAVHVDPGVAIGGLDCRVAQHIGNDFERMPGSQETCCKGMAQKVNARRPGRLARTARRSAVLMIALRLFSSANGSNGAQWRRKTLR